MKPPPLTDPPESDPGADARTGRAGRGRRKRREREDRESRRRARQRPAPAGGRLQFGPRPIQFVESRPTESGLFHSKRRIDFGLILAGLFALGTLVFVGMLIQRALRVNVDWEGLDDGDSLSPTAAADTELRIDLGSRDRLERSTLVFDGEPVEDPQVDGETLVWAPPDELEEGDHSLELRIPRAVVGDATITWDFTIDSTPPSIEVPSAVDPVRLDQSARVRGRVEEGATLTADGNEVDVGDDGRFTLNFARPPAGEVILEAVDPAGNSARRSVVVPVPYPATRGVHVTGPAWESEVLRNGILQLIDQGRIDAVVLDLKDEGGVLHYDSDLRRAHEIGAVSGFYDLEEAVATLKDRGVRVIGRIVAFRDPKLAGAAWGAGHRDLVVQTPDGRPWAAPGEYTNPASRAVRRYNLDIALEAVGRGVDDIMWDDVRRPNGEATSMVLPGQRGSAEDAIVGFLAESHAQLRRRGAFQGVTTVGVAFDRGGLVGQDVTRMARNADYVSPILFPGYWSSGELGVGSPSREPGEFTRRAVERYRDKIAGTGAVLVPWIQDFSVGGVGYGEGEVRAQIDGARAAGADRVHVWNNSVRYTGAALDPGR